MDMAGSMSNRQWARRPVVDFDLFLNRANCGASLGRKSRAAHLRQNLRPISRRNWEFVALSSSKPVSMDTIEYDPTKRGNLTGRWHKQPARSDPMDEAFEMVNLPWILRRAIGILRYMDIEDTEDHFKTVLKAGGILDVVESYTWNGELKQHPRRDKRKGKHTAKVVIAENGPCIKCQWNNPYGGMCDDTFILSDDGMTLTVDTYMKIKDTGRECVYKTVYTRVHKD